MAKFDFLPECVNRKRRIIGRIINSKALPRYTYRLDTRAPALIRVTGFQPRVAAGTVALMDHVNGSFPADHPQANSLSKPHSQWVSTGAYGFLKRIDATFAHQLLHTNVYRIDTQIAQQTGNFTDVNDTFDKAGVNRPYATQREWAKVGGIDQAAVIDYMTGQAFYEQLGDQLVAPDEGQLQGWVQF